MAQQDPGYPYPELLRNLQERLLEKSDCLPNCTDSPKMLLVADKDSIRIVLKVNAGVETAVPIPEVLKSWMPSEVLLDGNPAQGLMKDHEGGCTSGSYMDGDVDTGCQSNWQPWPGEKVLITVSWPQAIPGRTVTIEEAKLNVTPGERYTNGALSFKVRTSKGGEHRVTVPEAAEIMEVSINKKNQPIKREKNEIIIPLEPGLQSIGLKWHQISCLKWLIKSPVISVGSRAVNADISFNLPSNRWIIFTKGPRFGPAVLFWSYLLVILIGALGLRKTNLTPLKTSQWIFLGLGLTQITPPFIIIIVGWLLMLGVRRLKWLRWGWECGNMEEKNCVTIGPKTFAIIKRCL